MSEPVLEIQNLRKSFGALQATDDVSLSLHLGEIHALIGPNGAGKSTLIKQIAGSVVPDSGRVRLHGSDVTLTSVAHRARAGLGRTFQVSSLAMECTVLQNTVLGCVGQQRRSWSFFAQVMHNADLRRAAMNALEQVGLAEQALKRTSDLSHGERRLLEVAVALTLQPKALLMDEPMAGLGTSGSQRMIGFLDELRQRSPILLVEHDMEAVFALADRISVLVYGRIIATGTVEEIRANAEVRRAYLGEDA